jgi:hypothetical protein
MRRRHLQARNWWVYVGLAILFVASYMLASTLPTGAIIQDVAANVGIAALVGALFQLFRDHAAQERELLVRRDDQQFQVGMTSHMSNVVFNKHVLFCEEYVTEVNATVDTLVQRHATVDAVDHANRLYAIRRKYATWVTTAMSTRLASFEDAVREVGAKAHFVEVTRESPHYAEQRAKAIEFVYSEFERILPQHFGRQAEDGIGSETIVARVREILSIERLVELRARLVERAHTTLPATN